MPHGAEQLLFELFAIFVAAKVMGEIFERLSLPAVLGEILAGVALGSYAIGWIQPSDTSQSVAEVGAIFVLFSAGLETSPNDLIRVGREALLVAVAGVVAPFVLGFIYMNLRGDATTEAIFVGAAMVATSVGITARVLGDLGVLATRTAKIILGAAVFDDILGMVLLAVLAGLASTGGLHWLHLGVLIGEATGYRWRAGYIVTYALCEAIALYGFVLRFASFSLSQVAPFYLAGFILLLFFNPRRPSNEIG